jgi:hypothetical protein
MFHQRQEERDVFRRDPLFIERQDEIAGSGVDEKVRVLDALGDPLVGEELAQIVIRQEIGQVFRRNVGIDGHDAPFWRISP